MKICDKKRKCVSACSVADIHPRRALPRLWRENMLCGEPCSRPTPRNGTCSLKADGAHPSETDSAIQHQASKPADAERHSCRVPLSPVSVTLPSAEAPSKRSARECPSGESRPRDTCKSETDMGPNNSKGASMEEQQAPGAAYNASHSCTWPSCFILLGYSRVTAFDCHAGWWIRSGARPKHR